MGVVSDPSAAESTVCQWCKQPIGQDPLHGALWFVREEGWLRSWCPDAPNNLHSPAEPVAPVEREDQEPPTPLDVEQPEAPTAFADVERVIEAAGPLCWCEEPAVAWMVDAWCADHLPSPDAPASGGRTASGVKAPGRLNAAGASESPHCEQPSEPVVQPVDDPPQRVTPLGMTADFQRHETAKRLARFFHETYEALAPSHGWETQERSRTEWDEVPPENRSLMIAVALRVLDRFSLPAAPDVPRPTREAPTRDVIVAELGNYVEGLGGPDAAADALDAIGALRVAPESHPARLVRDLPLTTAHKGCPCRSPLQVNDDEEWALVFDAPDAPPRVLRALDVYEVPS